ncbi:uncharacterized protein N7515_004678 [Penicillium bovifimosum]|uniref:Uncharacterized protein n=1 Tax=Penicillium bovifimosum TaxID=126998 RepID=A0A9W9H0P9_9EURO|nr:uncharacterized protein N7515_004678 [Penicillium bovifimosum]KAJ5135400.1 hypothetical protein N7515_004678 [Penicillium bovifimosum]
MGLECIYPESQGRHKRQEKNKSHRAAVQLKARATGLIVCDEADPCARKDQPDCGKVLAWDDFQDMEFDARAFDESLFTSLIMDNPKQHISNGGPSSSNSGTSKSTLNPTPRESVTPERRNCAPLASWGQLPESPTAEPLLPSLLGPSTRSSIGDSGFWEEAHVPHGLDIWAMGADEHGTPGSTSERLSLEPQNKTRTESDGCCCLLSSISFLERLVQKSASRENRIDLLLTEVRDSIETLAVFMACEKCAARVAQNMLLAMTTRQISLICKAMANCYKTMLTCGLDDANPSQQKPGDISADAVEISVSTYRVKRSERLHLIKSLVDLQIIEFQQCIDKVKFRYRNWPDQGLPEALVEAEDHLKLAQFAIRNQT